MRNIIHLNQEYFLVCQPLTVVRDLYKNPLSSSVFGIAVASCKTRKTVVISATAEFKKCVCVPFFGDRKLYVTIPLMHTI